MRRSSVLVDSKQMPGRARWRKLAHKTPKRCDTQHGTSPETGASRPTSNRHQNCGRTERLSMQRERRSPRNSVRQAARRRRGAGQRCDRGRRQKARHRRADLFRWRHQYGCPRILRILASHLLQLLLSLQMSQAPRLRTQNESIGPHKVQVHRVNACHQTDRPYQHMASQPRTSRESLSDRLRSTGRCLTPFLQPSWYGRIRH